MEYAISRYINGVRLNEKEFALDEEHNVRLFDSFQAAKDFLLTRLVDCSEKDLQEDLDSGAIQIEIYNQPQ